jgi:hypothetical protein
MKEVARSIAAEWRDPEGFSVTSAARAEVVRLPRWRNAFAGQRKDRRYYDLVEETLFPDIAYRYAVIRDPCGEVCAIQPYFIVEQDLLAGVPGHAPGRVFALLRRNWPGFMRMRTLMVGCVAGEGHLDSVDDPSRQRHARLLAAALPGLARAAGASLVVLKEFPSEYRAPLECFRASGYTRVPSLPMVQLNMGYADFEDYLRRGVSRGTRGCLRRNLRASACAAPIEMSVVTDASAIIDEIYPLYLQVYHRSSLQFERLTRAYLCGIGRAMPDKVRFFVWRQCGRAIAFSLSMVQGGAICNEYMGMDYAVALELHLYYYMFRDVMNWAIARGYSRCFSTSLSYDPKWHLRFQLYPLDLYVRHMSPVGNAILKRLLPYLEPARHDRTLPRFANYKDLWEGVPRADRNRTAA